jgi:hypothetical protein
MTGETFYGNYRAAALGFGLGPQDYPSWDTLGAQTQTIWEQLAYEQDLRDRELPERLKEISYG